MLPDTHEHNIDDNSSTDCDYLLDKLPKLGEGHEETTRQSSASRVLNLQMLNNARALTKKLPPETMSLIFRHTHLETPESERLKCTLSLGHISFHWRQIAWSTPQLWTTLSTCVSPHSMESVVQLLQLHLHNVGGLPFCLDLSFKGSRPPKKWSHHALIKVLSDEDSSRKIHSLSLSSLPRPLALCLSNGTFPHLESLDLGAGSIPSVRKVSLTNLPFLSKLCLYSIIPTEIELSWPNITYLDLVSIPIDICVKIFVQCPNLVDGRVCCPTSPSGSAVELALLDSVDNFTFCHLEMLSWSYHASPICLTVFQRLCTPSLQELEWVHLPDNPPESLLSTLTNFPSISTLTRLSFVDLEVDSPAFFRDLFAHTKNLQVLGFDMCNYFTIENAFSILSSSPPQVMYLPLLNEVLIGSDDSFIDHSDHDLQRVVTKLVKSRCHVPGFRLGVMDTGDWADNLSLDG